MHANDPAPAVRSFDRTIGRIERLIVGTLILMMIVVVALSTFELGWIIIKDAFTPPVLLLDLDELLEIFGFFLLILIGVELLSSIKAYLRDNVIHVEIVLEVALIAVARKVIVLDVGTYDAGSMLAIAALVIALTGAIYLVRRSARGVSTPAAVAFQPD